MGCRYSTRNPSVDFDLSADLTLSFLLTCPQCGDVHLHPADELPEGAELHCGCGAVMEIDGDDFVAIQRQLRDQESPS